MTFCARSRQPAPQTVRAGGQRPRRYYCDVSWLSRLRPRRGALRGAIAFVVVDRLNGKSYIDLQIFDREAPTRIAQGFYDPATRRVVDCRLDLYTRPVTDPELLRLIDEGAGVVFFSPSFYS
jgi:hypothetical protein